jgi:uncharacterized protein (TIGR03000 family)
MRRLAVLILLTIVLWLGTAGDSSACFFRCGWGCGYSYCCSPCWSPCYYPCYNYGYAPCYYSYYSPCYYPVYSYGYAPCYYPSTYIYISSASPAVAPDVASPVLATKTYVDQPTKPVKRTPPVEKAAPAADRARVIVTLPADARLTVEGKTVATGSGERHFISPPLEKGTNYRYTFKAEVVRNDQTVTQTREVRVRAGEETRVRFDLPPNQIVAKASW